MYWSYNLPLLITIEIIITVKDGTHDMLLMPIIASSVSDLAVYMMLEYLLTHHFTKKLTEQELCPGNRTMFIDSIEVPLYLIGDSAYPIQTWLMKPFPHNTQNLIN